MSDGGDDAAASHPRGDGWRICQTAAMGMRLKRAAWMFALVVATACGGGSGASSPGASVRDPHAVSVGLIEPRTIRDSRITRAAPRSRPLLITELSSLERLNESTSKGSAERVQLLRRLAEGYIELEARAAADMVASTAQAEEAKRTQQRSSYDAAKKESAQARAIWMKAAMKAIGYYRILKRDYPEYSKRDEVLYYLAYEYELSRDLDRARKAYLELIESAPNSRFVPLAFLAFGELFIEEAATNPAKFGLARSAYNKVLMYPAAGEATCLSYLRLAEISAAQGQPAQSQTQYANAELCAKSN